MKIIGNLVPILAVLSTSAQFFAEGRTRGDADLFNSRQDVIKRQFNVCPSDDSNTELNVTTQGYRYKYTTTGCPPWDWTAQTTPNDAESDVKTYYAPIYPVVGDEPVWVDDYGVNGVEMGPIGITVYGTAIFANVALGGANAVETEAYTMDGCLGHPQDAGIYHHHSRSSCLDNLVGFDSATGHSKLQGYAFDGYGIYGGANIGPPNKPLDECQGHTHKLPDGSTRYHYHLTSANPYSIVCLKGCVANGNNFDTLNCACNSAGDCPTQDCVSATCGMDKYCHFTALSDGTSCAGGTCSSGECVAGASDYQTDSVFGAFKPPTPMADDEKRSVFGSVNYQKPGKSGVFVPRWAVAGVGLGISVALVAFAVMKRRRLYDTIESSAATV